MDRTRFWLAHAGAPFLAFAGLVALFACTDLDYALTDPFYDFGLRRWPLAKVWWANDLIHNWGRVLVISVGATALGVVVQAIRRPELRPWGRSAMYLVLVIGLSVLTVRLWQEVTPHHCPREIDRYGGPAPRLGLWATAPPGFERGHCFPSKHGAVGFSLLALYFAFGPVRPGWSVPGLLAGLAAGTVFTFGQLVRGAHFVSHSVWAAAICWGWALLLYGLILRPAESAPRDR